MDFGFYLKEQFRLHPSMQPQDVVKQCYQAAHGAEHMLLNIEKAKAYFYEEYEATPASFIVPLYEPISEDMCRVNIAAWKARNLAPEDLFELFKASTHVSASIGDKSAFNNCIKPAEQLIKHGKAPFTFEEWQAYYEEYKLSGMPVVHHSEAYRLAERPAYRIVLKSLLHTDIT